MPTFSIFSTNSTINSLWKKSILNSPSKLTTSTPAEAGNDDKEHDNDDNEDDNNGKAGMIKRREEHDNQYKATDYLDSADPSLGETLVNDIESFLQRTNNRNDDYYEDQEDNYDVSKMLIGYIVKYLISCFF